MTAPSSDDEVRAIAAIISDPGSVVPRDPDESVSHWSARALLAARGSNARTAADLRAAMVVWHRGPLDDDSQFMRQVADRLEANVYVGGSNVRTAAARLIRAALAAAAQDAS